MGKSVHYSNVENVKRKRNKKYLKVDIMFAATLTYYTKWEGNIIHESFVVQFGCIGTQHNANKSATIFHIILKKKNIYPMASHCHWYWNQ